MNNSEKIVSFVSCTQHFEQTQFIYSPRIKKGLKDSKRNVIWCLLNVRLAKNIEDIMNSTAFE